jgi:hypothetical protein
MRGMSVCRTSRQQSRLRPILGGGDQGGHGAPRSVAASRCTHPGYRPSKTQVEIHTLKGAAIIVETRQKSSRNPTQMRMPFIGNVRSSTFCRLVSEVKA